MNRKIILFFLLACCFQFCMHPTAKAQTRDSATNFILPYTDTTCYGAQLTFWAVQYSYPFSGSTDTFTNTSYKWYVNGVFTGVVQDTFYTTAVTTGDTVWCVLYFTNSLGIPDSFKSNYIIVYRVATMNPNVLISLTAGVNPACGGQPLTFTAYPINGGTNPVYQWYLNGIALPGEDSSTISQYFNLSDTITCQMVSNSPCAPFDTVMSAGINIVQEHYYASLIMTPLHDSVCNGYADTFITTLSLPGNNPTFQWFVNGDTAVGAIASTYISDTLHNGDSIFCIMTTHDTCVLNTTVFSNGYKVKVKHVYLNGAAYELSAGANPGCLDSPCTFTIIYDSFGVSPAITWFINGVVYATNVNFITDTFLNGDTVSVKINETDQQCYLEDTMYLPSTIMMRDTTPVAPLVSLIGDLLEANNVGTYEWFGPLPYGIIAGQNNYILHPMSTGSYYAIQIGNGSTIFNCPSLPSNIIYIALDGVKNVYLENVKIYPNPTSGILCLDWDGEKVNMKLEIYNTIGQALSQQEINNQSHFETDLSSLAPGIYFLVLRDEDGSSKTYKFSIEK